MSTLAQQKWNLRLIMILLVLFISSPRIYAQQTTPVPASDPTTLPDLKLYIDETKLIIQIIHPEAVSVAGLKLAVLDEKLTEYTPEVRFGVIVVRDYLLPSGTCLVYQAANEIMLPPECVATMTSIVRVGVGDEFWMLGGQRRDVYITRNGTMINQFCPAHLTECELYFNTSPDGGQDDSVIAVEALPAAAQPQVIYPDATLTSNGGRIADVAWSPDGQLLLTGHDNGDACLWDPNDPALTTFLTCIPSAHAGGVTAVEWRPGGELLQFATAGQNNLIRVWNATIDVEQIENVVIVEETAEYRHNGVVEDLSWRADGAFLASVGNDRLTIWDVAEGQELRSVILNAPIAVDWQSDGRYIVSLDNVGVVRVTDITGEEQSVIVGIYDAPALGIDLAWNSGIGGIGTIGTDGVIRLYDYDAGTVCPQPRCMFQALGQRLPALSTIVFSPDGNYLAVSMLGSVQLLQAGTPYQFVAKHAVRDAPETNFASVTWSPDSGRIAAVDEQGRVFIWSVNTALPDRLTLLNQWNASSREVLALTWSPNGNALAVVARNLRLSIWDIAGQEIGDGAAHTNVPLAIDWNQSQSLVATGGCGPMGIIWQITAVPRNVLSVPFDTENCVTGIAFHPNPEENILVTADEDGLLRIWDWVSETQIDAKQLALEVNDIEWNADGTRLASVDDNGAVTVFDALNPDYPEVFIRQPQAGIPLNALSWSPDGVSLATASEDGWVAVWDTLSNITGVGFEASYRLDVYTSPVVGVSWSAEQNWLVSAYQNGYIVVWDALTGQRLAETRLETTPTTVKWSPVGAAFAVADESGGVTLFGFVP